MRSSTAPTRTASDAVAGSAAPGGPGRRLAAAAACVLLAAGCAEAGTAGTTTADGGGSKSPVKVGLVYSRTGPLAAYGKQYLEGFKAGTDGGEPRHPSNR
ncbi:hypothetical protein [Kitasatospora sp. NPDC091207]|uniref:hypothetical protein n=1 Tax=Kitasatospora sp. NPDC091207 TaxID=3364083 RepID=UPI0037FA0B74